MKPVAFLPADKGGRRTNIERRQFSYTCHIPERRSGNDRRSRKPAAGYAAGTRLPASARAFTTYGACR